MANKKINLIVTRIVEKASNKGMVRVEADLRTDMPTLWSVLNIDAKKGEYEVGDKIVITIEKV